MSAMKYLDANDYAIDAVEIIAKELAEVFGMEYDRAWVEFLPPSEDQEWLREKAESVFLSLLRAGKLSVRTEDLGDYGLEMMAVSS